MLLRTLCLSLAAAGAVLMGQMQPAHAQAVVADVPPPLDCGPYGCVPEAGYADVAPGYAEPGYVVPPRYVPVDPGYAVAVGPDCYWKRGPPGNWKQKCG